MHAVQTLSEAPIASSGVMAAAAHALRPPHLRLQLRTLFKRSWRQVTRDKAAIKLRVLSNLQSAMVFGTIWWRLRRIQKSVASRLGMLQARSAFLACHPRISPDKCPISWATCLTVLPPWRCR